MEALPLTSIVVLTVAIVALAVAWYWAESKAREHESPQSYIPYDNSAAERNSWDGGIVA